MKNALFEKIYKNKFYLPTPFIYRKQTSFEALNLPNVAVISWEILWFSLENPRNT